MISSISPQEEGAPYEHLQNDFIVFLPIPPLQNEVKQMRSSFYTTSCTKNLAGRTLGHRDHILKQVFERKKNVQILQSGFLASHNLLPHVTLCPCTPPILSIRGHCCTLYTCGVNSLGPGPSLWLLCWALCQPDYK